MTEERLEVSFHDSLAALSRTDWDTCAGPDNPFLSYDFLISLEESGCVGAETGWQPYHGHVTRGGKTVAVMPLYLKGHSFGEYVFDHAWADAYERAGGRYYPKLQSSVPFSPVTGPRLLVTSEDANPADIRRAMLRAVADLTDRLGLSSLHLTFLPKEEADIAENAGLLVRTDRQFHWHNDGYTDFEAFLDALSSRKRKQIRKERRAAQKTGMDIKALTGADIDETHWDHFFACYIDTGARKWGQPYLNREFFRLLGERMADKILLVHCSFEGRDVASALNLIGRNTLYGRHWGALEDHDCLHFEACYYQAIDHAIRHGLACVEAGAQGPHKLARGYEPVETYSAHYLRDPGFHEAVARYLKHERTEVSADIAYFGEHTPFKKA